MKSYETNSSPERGCLEWKAAEEQQERQAQPKGRFHGGRVTARMLGSDNYGKDDIE
jgi:hypothetical protein